MPSLTITAVNTTAETLTAVGHGLNTGDRFRLRNIGGALPAATPTLTPVTDYFAIRVDNDHIKVAVSSSDAFVPTPVNLTGAGTGTNKIEYGLPYCIPTALAAVGAQIKSANDNSAWAAIVTLWNLVGGYVKTLMVSASAGTPSANTDVWQQSSNGVQGAPLTAWCLPINLPIGSTIIEIRVRVLDNATGPTKLMLTADKNVDGTNTVIGASAVQSSGAGAWQWLTKTGLSEVVTANTNYVALITTATGAAGCTVGHLEVDYLPAQS